MPTKRTARRGADRETKQFDLDRFFKRNKSAAAEGLEKAKENKGGFAEYDDGRYKLRYINGEIRQASSSKSVGFISKWKFLDGDYKGQTYTNWRGISDNKGSVDPEKFGWFLGDIRRLGYDVDELELDEVPDLLKQMKKDKPTITASLKSKGEFQNLNILRVLDDDEDEDDEDEDDDDKPKKKKKGRSKDDDEDEDSDEEDADEDDEDEDEKPKKKSTRKSKKDEDDDEDEEEEDEDDEDEDDEKPARKKKSRKSKDEDEDEEESEDEDEDEEEEKPARKKRGSKKKDDDDDEDADEGDGDEDDEEVSVTVGSIAKVRLKSGVVKAEVVEVLEDDNAIKVKTKDGKTVKVGSDKILDVEEPPKKKRSRK